MIDPAPESVASVMTLIAGADAGLLSPNRLVWLKRLMVESESAEQVIGWSIDNEAPPMTALRVVHVLAAVWYSQGHWDRAVLWLDRTLLAAEGVAPSADHSKVLEWRGVLHWQFRDYQAAIGVLDQAVTEAEAVGDQDRLGSALAMKGLAIQDGLSPVQSRASYERSVEVYRGSGNLWGEAWARYHLGLSYELAGDLDQAQLEYTESLRQFREAGDDVASARPLLGLGTIKRVRGDIGEARALLTESRERRLKTGDLPAIAGVTLQLAEVSREDGDVGMAIALAREAKEIFAGLRLVDRVERVDTLIEGWTRPAS